MPKQKEDGLTQKGTEQTQDASAQEAPSAETQKAGRETRQRKTYFRLRYERLREERAKNPELYKAFRAHENKKSRDLYERMSAEKKAEFSRQKAKARKKWREKVKKHSDSLELYRKSGRERARRYRAKRKGEQNMSNPEHSQPPPPYRPINVFSAEELQGIMIPQMVAHNFMHAAAIRHSSLLLQYRRILQPSIPLQTAQTVPTERTWTITRPTCQENSYSNIQYLSEPMVSKRMPALINIRDFSEEELEKMNLRRAPGIQDHDKMAQQSTMNSPQPGPSRSSHLSWNPGPTEMATPANTNNNDRLTENKWQQMNLQFQTSTATKPDLNVQADALDLSVRSMSAIPIDLTVPPIAQNDFSSAFGQPAVSPRRPPGPAIRTSPSRPVTQEQTQQKR